MSTTQWIHLVALLGVETVVLVGATALVERLTTRPHRRRGFWQAALLALALLWLAELAGFRRQPGPVAAGSASRTVTVTFGAEHPAGGSPSEAALPAPSPVARAAESGPLQWPAWLWLAGTVGWLARAALLRAVLTTRVRRSAQTVPAAESDALGWTALRARLGLGPVRLLRLAGLRGPVAFGVLRPTVAVPDDFAGRFPRTQRQAMLAHELAHLAGRDPWWLWLADFAVALAWWHPAAWWARARLRAAGEAAADAASTLVPDGPVALAESLVGFGRELTATGGFGVAGSGRASELARRVQALLAPSLAWVRPGRALRLGSRSGAVATAGTLLLAPTGSGGKPWHTLAGETRPRGTVSGLLADLQFREVVTALDEASTQPVEFASVRGGSMEVPAGVPRPGRTFPVDPWSFGAALGLSGPAQGLLADGKDPVLQERVRAWAARSGVQFDQATSQNSDRSIFYHERENLLHVRADEAELKKLEQAIRRMPPHPKVKQAYVALRDPMDQATRPPAPAGGATVPRSPTRGSPVNESPSTTEASLVESRKPDPEQHPQLQEVPPQRAAGLSGQPAQAAVPAPTQVELRVTLVEVTRWNDAELGLDWLFGQSPTNNPATRVERLTNAPAEVSPLAGRITWERQAIRGEWAALTTNQFAALRRTLEQRGGVDLLSAPRVTTAVGRETQVAVQDFRSVVLGPQVVPATATNEASLVYEAERLPVGPTVHLRPEFADGAWELEVKATLQEFLGYDEPAKGQRVRGADGTYGVPALPRLRERVTEAAARCRPGEMVALRGPEAQEVARTVDRVPVLGRVPLLGRAFTRRATETRVRRLFVFVEPFAVDAQGRPGL